MIPLLLPVLSRCTIATLTGRIDAIYAAVAGQVSLIQCLAEMYSEPVMTLIEDQEASGGNAEWEPSW